ncbi:MAG: MFS transporter, partial [Sedimentisphaerales bacterium]|nr:MFS transporter [Sedimentisphaerales bacterium]
CLYLAAILSVVMAASYFLMPATPPTKSGAVPILKAMQMLNNTNVLIFMVLSMIAAGMMQFYFLGTAQFMQDMGISSKNVPASMAIAQVVQAAATFLILGLMIDKVGFKWTLVIGTTCWLLLYIAYVAEKPRWLIVGSQSMHGVAYVLFIIAGQIFANAVAPEDIRGSMQALIFAATTGVGLFLGTHLAGVTMDTFKKGDKFQWRPIFAVPCLIMLACTLGFILLFKG